MILARFKTNIRNLTIIQCYAPTEIAEKDKKEEFHHQLSEKITTVRKRDVIIVMGDMNAKVGPNNEGLEHVMGRHGIRNMNENGELFSELCASCDLINGGTVFPHKTCHKVPWVSPDNITESQIAYIAISKRFRRSPLDVRNKREADIASDQHLMIANFRFKILAARKKTEIRRKKYNVQKLQIPSVKAVPLQAWSGPEGSRKLRFPDYITTAQDGGRFVSLTHRPPLHPGNAPGTHFC
jgi:hypothetical protein